MKHIYKIENVKAGDSIPIYGAKKIRFQSLGGSITIKLDSNLYVTSINIMQQTPLYFPIIDGKSPSSVTILYVSAENLSLLVYIDELGGVPSDDYWKL